MLAPPAQFTLVDHVTRFCPASPAQPMPWGARPAPKPDPWPHAFPDEPLNHLGDGFKIVWIDPREPYWHPRMDAARPPGLPDSWLRPIDFRDGTIHYRIEVFEKPNASQPTTLLSRLTTDVHHGTHNVWLGHGVCVFKTTGTHYFAQPVSSHRPFTRDSQFNWDRPVYELQLVVSDLRGACVHRTVEQAHNAYDGTPDLSLYLPLKVRYSAIVTAPGHALDRPAWW